MVRFSNANAKLIHLASIPAISPYLVNRRKIYSFDLLSGYTCPFAKSCLSRVRISKEGTRSIEDGPNTEFRCFSATQELIFPAVYNLRLGNTNIVQGEKSIESIVNTIEPYIPEDLGVCRIHVGGDFYSKNYMRAWSEIARNNSDKLFYAYTKSLPYWVESKLYYNSINNFVLTASYGGRYDNLIKEYNLRSAIVVYHPGDTDLEIDHDDSHAANPATRKTDFALLLHGIQPKNSVASQAIKRLNKEGVKYSYGK